MNVINADNGTVMRKVEISPRRKPKKLLREKRNDLLGQALEYAERGFRVFPCRDKKPLSGLKWKQEATTDPEQIKEWFAKRECQIAIAAGTDSNIWVLDIDSDKKGLESLAALEADHGKLETLCVRSGGGGYHFYYKHLDGLKNVAGILMDGIDTRSDGGYVIAPPSLHESGNRYRWEEGFDPDKIQETPDWLIEKLEEKNIIRHKQVEPEETTGVTLTGKTTPYGRAALENACEEMRQQTNGTRNHTLNKNAFSLGRLVAGGEIAENDMIHALTGAALSTGLGKTEIRKTIGSGLKAGKEHPRSAPGEPKSKLNLFDKNKYHYTEVGNSYRFKDFARGDIIYVPEWKRWLLWDGTRWAQDGTGQIIRIAKKLVDKMYHQAINIKDEEQRKAALKHTLKTEKLKEISSFIALAKPELSVKHDALDSDPYLLNTINGIIDFKNNIFREHRREDLITKRINFPLGDCTPSEWLRFLNTIFQGDLELIRYIKKALGYSLTGDVSEDCLFILYGTGRNGKSTFLNVLSKILGDYACNTPAETLMARKNDTISNDVARLEGARLVTAYETEDNKRLAEAKIKALTGGDPITARFLHKEYFEFWPTFKVFLATNHKPRIKGNDEGIWRRIKLLPCVNTIPKEDVDPYLYEKLIAEAPNILGWMVQGYKLWQDEGLEDPTAVKLATLEYRSESDIIGLFLADRTREDSSAVISKKELYEKYKTWATENSEFPLSSHIFSKTMLERGYRDKRGTGGKRMWIGLSII